MKPPITTDKSALQMLQGMKEAPFLLMGTL